MYVTVWCQRWGFMPITRAMDEQLKALLEGINALKSGQEDMQKSQEDTKNELKEGMQKGLDDTKNELKERMEKCQELKDSLERKLTMLKRKSIVWKRK
ncbi:hypothetical protein TNCV_2126011 [Trichonephila clavipes]|nr:hypothetical protein TNCV_2126011 [Trichonephila clavipes]